MVICTQICVFFAEVPVQNSTWIRVICLALHTMTYACGFSFGLEAIGKLGCPNKERPPFPWLPKPVSAGKDPVGGEPKGPPFDLKLVPTKAGAGETSDGVENERFLGAFEVSALSTLLKLKGPPNLCLFMDAAKSWLFGCSLLVSKSETLGEWAGLEVPGNVSYQKLSSSHFGTTHLVEAYSHDVTDWVSLNEVPWVRLTWISC